jgi:2,4-dienoyl-CoA reductase-like NADH-dependent reductase (Old Yellow Enzyme family)
MTAKRYPHVFSPLQIGPHRLKNRILMGSNCGTGSRVKPGMTWCLTVKGGALRQSHPSAAGR